MNREGFEGFEEFAKNAIARVIRGDASADEAVAGIVDVLLGRVAPVWLGTADFTRLQHLALVEVHLGAKRLRAAPRNALAWILKRIAKTYAESSRWMAADRNRAAALQQRMLPARTFEAHGMEVAFGLRPFDVLSGDFFDYSVTERDTLLLMGDVVGKGSHAGLVAAFLLGQFRALTSRIRDPCKLIGRLSAALNIARGSGQEYATILVARWLPSQRCLSIANAGSLPPLLVRDGVCCKLGEGGHPAGMFATTKVKGKRFQVGNRDVVLMTSDGLPDQPSIDGDDFRVEELTRQIGYDPLLSAAALLEKSWWVFDQSTRNEFAQDDQTIIVIRFR